MGEALPIAVVGRCGIHAGVAAGGIVFPDFDEAGGIGVGERAEEDVIGEREGGGGRADAEGGNGDGGESECGRAAEAAGGPGEVAAQDVPMGSDGAGAGIGDGVEPEEEDGERVGGLLEAECKKRAEIGGVLGAEAGGVEMEEGSVEAHQAFPGANPRARAMRTSCDMRRDSASATARPNGVMR